MLRLNFKILLLSASLFAAIGLSGCATGGISTGAPDFQSKFARGDIRLTCSLSCAGTAGSSRRKMRGFYDNKLWMDLAKEVSGIGYDNDQQYFYLGTAAAGLGYRNAARTYFNLAKSTANKCGGSINVCDGFTFPNDINAWIAALNNADTKDAQAAAAAKAAAQQKASTLAPTRQAQGQTAGSQPSPQPAATPTPAPAPAPSPILPPSTVKPGPIKSDSLI
jgi:hypothetical protein